eukprot:5580379-Amphidinium_carterae.1
MLRDVCEYNQENILQHEYEGGTIASSHSGRITSFLMYVTFRSLHRSAHLTACAKLGILPGDEISAAVKDLGLGNQEEEEINQSQEELGQ